VFLAGNQLTSLDVSNIAKLKWFELSNNQLTSLDVSNNTALGVMLLSDMPTLNMVCVWGVPFPPDGVYIETTYSPNLYFTADCTVGD
jgi:Leucine-rich repeat (LRR) protein